MRNSDKKKFILKKKKKKFFKFFAFSARHRTKAFESLDLFDRPRAMGKSQFRMDRASSPSPSPTRRPIALHEFSEIFHAHAHVHAHVANLSNPNRRVEVCRHVRDRAMMVGKLARDGLSLAVKIEDREDCFRDGKLVHVGS